MGEEMTLPDDVDLECVALCEALNLWLGIQTVESCCGHGKRNFHIWFRAESLSDLPDVLYWFDT